MTLAEWTERSLGSIVAFMPRSLPPGLLVAFSSRGLPPEEETAPTAFLARSFAAALGLDGTPIVRATQVHGNRAVTIAEPPRQGEVLDAGRCDALATSLAGVGLVVQTADCIPILLAGEQAIATVHAGWRGSAANAAAAGVDALTLLGETPENLRAWLGPAIGACCYEVGKEVAARFAGDSLRRETDGSFRLDLPAVNQAQLEAAGIRRGNILVHPACTKCGGEKYASYRRDGGKSGRMIGLVARLSPGSSQLSALSSEL